MQRRQVFHSVAPGAPSDRSNPWCECSVRSPVPTGLGGPDSRRQEPLRRGRGFGPALSERTIAAADLGSWWVSVPRGSRRSACRSRWRLWCDRGRVSFSRARVTVAARWRSGQACRWLGHLVGSRRRGWWTRRRRRRRAGRSRLLVRCGSSPGLLGVRFARAVQGRSAACLPDCMFWLPRWLPTRCLTTSVSGVGDVSHRFAPRESDLPLPLHCG
jgi:hypothetical protein